MLRRCDPSPGAARARRSRQRLKAGRRVYRIELHERRLRLALDEAGWLEEGGELEPALAEVLEHFIAKWLGPENKPCA
jgi:hypothetical protein